MKLSDFENEKALDVLADIMEPAAKILSDEKVRELYNNGKPKLFLVQYVLKNHKEEVVMILATLNDEKPEEFRFNLLSLTRDLLDVVNDKELEAVFISQGQMMGDEFSGSAMANTEADET